MRETGGPPAMRTIRELDGIEVRVLGALLEKQQATPDVYPMTVNALIAACNQKSNRAPVTALTETEVVEALERLRRDVLVWRSDGARSERWSQAVSRRLELDAETRALLTLLMLRGPQTPGQLRARSGRLHPFADLAEVEGALRRMAAGDAPLALELPRQPGRRESRWAQLLGVRPEADAETPAAPRAAPKPSAGPGLSERLDALERLVAELADEVERLRSRLG